MNKETIARMNVREELCKRATRSLTAFFIVCACAGLVAFSGCKKDQAPTNSNPLSSAAPAPGTADATQIIERYRAIDNSRDSAIKLRAKIESAASDGYTSAPPTVELMMFQKRGADGGRRVFIEFTAPDQERDRGALIRVSTEGDVEGTRYAQSTDSFVTSEDVMVEESLFGMTLQEFAGGQPEKYDFKLLGEETVQSQPVYRLEGKLKQGAESKFHRMVLLISKESFYALVAEFYDNKDNLTRSITVSEAKQIDGHWTRMRWTVDNRARQKKIDFETVEAKYDRNISDSIFTHEHLKTKAKR